MIRELFKLKLEDFSSAEAYIERIKNLTNDLKGNEITFPEPVLLSMILFNLTEGYETFVQSILQQLRRDPKAYTFDTLATALLNKAKGRKDPDNIYLSKVPRSKDNKVVRYSHYQLHSHVISNYFFKYPDKAPAS